MEITERRCFSLKLESKFLMKISLLFEDYKTICGIEDEKFRAVHNYERIAYQGIDYILGQSGFYRRVRTDRVCTTVCK